MGGMGGQIEQYGTRGAGSPGAHLIQRRVMSSQNGSKMVKACQSKVPSCSIQFRRTWFYSTLRRLFSTAAGRLDSELPLAAPADVTEGAASPSAQLVADGQDHEACQSGSVKVMAPFEIFPTEVRNLFLWHVVISDSLRRLPTTMN